MDLAILFVLVASSMVNTQNMDLEFWMTELPPRLRELPVIYLAIPGSHDSMTYGISRSSELAPDAPEPLKNLYPLFRGTIIRWSVTQAVDTTRQLDIGIRYFDLRIASKTGTDRLFFTHGLYAGEISGPLIEIKQFLDTHPKEIVILDFQHFYNMTTQDHQVLVRVLLNIFGRRICHRRTSLQSISLNSMYREEEQVIIVYRHRLVYESERFWRPEQMPTPWPQAETTTDLLSFLGKVKRHPGTGFVHQAILTPTPRFIVLRWTSNIRDRLAIPVSDHVFPKIRSLSPGPPVHPDARSAPVNVVIADFVELHQNEFPKMVVQLNYKLLGS